MNGWRFFLNRSFIPYWRILGSIHLFPWRCFCNLHSTGSTFAIFPDVWPSRVPQQLYTELSQCYQTLITSEARLRQSHQELSGLLAQRDKNILELQAQIQQQQQDQMHSTLQQCRHTALCTPLHRQTNFKVIGPLCRCYSKVYYSRLKSISVTTSFSSLNELNLVCEAHLGWLVGRMRTGKPQPSMAWGGDPFLRITLVYSSLAHPWSLSSVFHARYRVSLGLCSGHFLTSYLSLSF